MIIKYFSLLLSIFFLGCGSADSKSGSESPPLTQLLLPLYSVPTDTQEGFGNIWDTAADAAKEIPICVIFGVIRPHNDPVGLPNDDYILGLSKLRDSGAKILAYVETDYGSRDSDAIKTDVEAYAMHFDIDGIFFDEVNGSIQFSQHYNALTTYAKSFSTVDEVMLNSPGVGKTFIQNSIADKFLVFENFYKDWDSFDETKYEGLEYETLNIIVHTVPDATTMKSVLNEANQKQITNLYITDKEFAYLPSYWDDLVLSIQEKNALIQ